MRELQDRCEAESFQRLPELGKRLPKLYASLDEYLTLLYDVATCRRSCPGGAHTVQYFLGKGINAAVASIRLAVGGLYDESLVLTRIIGEMANLVALFVYEPTAQTEWTAASARERRAKFSPVQVRLRIERSGSHPPVDEERYALLSSLAAHATPDTRPQAHNPARRAIVGPLYQEFGLFLALNEIGIALAPLGAAAAFVGSSSAVSKRITSVGMKLVDEGIGRFTIENLEQAYAEFAQAQSTTASPEPERG